jgi:hypothetical protein
MAVPTRLAVSTRAAGARSVVAVMKPALVQCREGLGQKAAELAIG